MTHALDHPLVRDYLLRLDAATLVLPADERDDVREGIRTHLVEALAEARSDADVHNALDALGRPEDIVGADPSPPASPARRGALEVVAVIALLVGGFVVPVLGWFVGVGLLWVSQAWTTRDKLIGTVVLPGGLLAPLALLLFPVRTDTCTALGDGLTACETGPASVWLVIPAIVLAAAAPIGTAIYLLRRTGADRRPAAVGPKGGPGLTGLDTAAVVLVMIGGFVVPVVGWLAGIVLAWLSAAWTAQQKLVATAVPTVGFAMLGGYGYTAGIGLVFRAAWLYLALAWLASGAYLLRTAGRARPDVAR